MVRVISLGTHIIRPVDENDPNWTRKMVGDFPTNRLEGKLTPDSFRPHAEDPEEWRDRKGIDDWPKQSRMLEMIAVNFGANLPDYQALLCEAATLPNDLKKGGFPHLTSQLSAQQARDMNDRSGSRLHNLVIVDENSIWRRNYGELCILSRHFDNPEWLGLYSTPICPVRCVFGTWEWYLFYHE